MSFGFVRLFQNPLRVFTGFGAPLKCQIHHITGFNPAPATRIMPCSIENTASQLVEAGSAHMAAGGAWSFISTRFWRRVHYIKEQKRLRKFSWKVRVSTEQGRRIIMKRMLAGRHCYTH